MNGNLAGYYALGSNVDATATSGWNAGAGFVPVGNSSTAFSGTFDGLGHTVTGLTINRPTVTNVGLFGYAGTGSVIQNVGIAGGSVNGLSNVGELVGINYGSVNNSNATGNVSGNFQVGGLIGGISYGAVSNSYATGNVLGTGNTIGGLAACLASTIKKSQKINKLQS